MRRRRVGFSLAEVLMVSVILGLIVAAVFEAVRGGRQVVRRVGRQYDATAHARVALERLRRDLSGAFDVKVPGFRFERGATADGGGTLALVTSRAVDPLRPAPGGDVVFVEYRLRPLSGAEGPFVLERRAIPLVPGQTPPRAGAAEPRGGPGAFDVVARRIVDLAMRFFDGKEWKPQWPPEAGLPRLVEARVRTAAGEGSAPLAVRTVVHIPASSPAGEVGP